MNIITNVVEIIYEDAYCNASNTAGMGAVTAAQPSILPGATIGSDFTNGGGIVGSGDLGSGWYSNAVGNKKSNSKRKSVYDKDQNWTKGNDKPPKRKKMKKFTQFKTK